MGGRVEGEKGVNIVVTILSIIQKGGAATIQLRWSYTRLC